MIGNRKEPAAPAATPDGLHPLQIQAWRAMGAAGRTRLGIGLRQKVWTWKLSALRRQHPDWSEAQARREVARIYQRGHT
jgi:hypothetical protein